MKNTVKITVCGVISALAIVLMLGTNIPIMLYTVPALTGILFLIPSVELGAKWGFLCFSITAILSVILPTEREALIMFIGLLGYYPTVKLLIERLNSRILGTTIKFFAFNVAVTGCFFVTAKLLGINIFQSEKFSMTVMIVAVYIVGNIAFAIFDFALTRILNIYFIKFRKQVRKIMHLNGK
ncbi:MAG: hypothetical protein IIX60_02440 [Clostridia bacterium]|nr:hypothetical protein [Clostridia bacterium]